MGEPGARGREYRTSIDRAGLALAVGAGAYGIAAVLLAALEGHGSIRAIAVALLLGAAFSSLPIAAIGGPVWLAMHLAGWRGPAHAAAAGAGIGFALFLLAQAGGLASPVGLGPDLAPALFGWLRAIGAGMILGALSAAIALLMWRVAYRRASQL